MDYIFLLERQDGFEADYDETIAFVIVAEWEDDARRMAEQNKAGEPRGTWINPLMTKATIIGYPRPMPIAPPNILLKSIKHG